MRSNKTLASNGDVDPGEGLTFLGQVDPKGTYVLRIHVSKPIRMAFGKFKKAKLVDVSAGEHLYVGSALGERATSLGRRLIRHASRTATKRPHAIRRRMLAEFPGIGLLRQCLDKPSPKRLKWNVDHLLDRRCADLVEVYALRSSVRLERELGRLMMADPHTVIFEPGLGANDIRGNTHLLRVEAEEEWWRELPAKLQSFLEDRV